MSRHSYSRCWIHLIWGTLYRRHFFNKETQIRLSDYLTKYAHSKQIYMKINHVNADHVHALIDLPTGMSIEEVMQLLKGSSSHWINRTSGSFSWGRGYGAFSVASSNLAATVAYILNQEEHHRKKSFQEEYEEFIQTYGIRITQMGNR